MLDCKKNVGKIAGFGLQFPFKTILEQVDARWKPHFDTSRPHAKAWSSPDLPVDFLKCCIDGTEDDILWEEMDESDPFADDDGMEWIVDEEGDLFYAAEDQAAVLEVNEREHCDIFGKSDFNGF